MRVEDIQGRGFKVYEFVRLNGHVVYIIPSLLVERGVIGVSKLIKTQLNEGTVDIIAIGQAKTKVGDLDIESELNIEEKEYVKKQLIDLEFLMSNQELQFRFLNKTIKIKILNSSTEILQIDGQTNFNFHCASKIIHSESLKPLACPIHGWDAEFQELFFRIQSKFSHTNESINLNQFKGVVINTPQGSQAHKIPIRIAELLSIKLVTISNYSVLTVSLTD